MERSRGDLTSYITKILHFGASGTIEIAFLSGIILLIDNWKDIPLGRCSHQCNIFFSAILPHLNINCLNITKQLPFWGEIQEDINWKKAPLKINITDTLFPDYFAYLYNWALGCEVQTGKTCVGQWAKSWNNDRNKSL